MTNRKTTKKALIFSALSLLLCFSMLIGTTFAWFTDSVTSAGNIIQSGTLDIAMSWADGTTDPAQAKWTDASTGAIFDYDNWEPGYAAVRHIKIENKGTLALKYTVVIEATGTVDDLADVIDVYFVDPAVQVTGRDKLTDANKIGTLTEVLGNMTELSSATMLAGETDTVTIALKMQETAGNEYQGKQIGDSFAIKLLATQLTSEKDSFDDQYDKATPWLGQADISWYDATKTEFTLGSAEELAGLAAIVNDTAKSDISKLSTDTTETTVQDTFEGKTIKLSSDIDLNGLAWTPIGNWDYTFNGTFDGQGHTISNLSIDDPDGEGIGFFGVTQNATIKGITLRNVKVNAYSMVAGLVGASYPTNISDCHITGNVEIVAEWAYVAGIAGYCYYGTQVDNCSTIAEGTGLIKAVTRNAVGGITAWLLEGNHNVTNCQVKNLNLVGWTNVGAITGFVHYNNTIEGCSVENVILTKTRADGNPGIGLIAGGWSYSASNAITLRNNTVKGAELNGTHIAYSAYNELYGSEYGGATTSNFVLENNTTENITNNLVEVKVVSTVSDLKNALANGGDYVLGADIALDEGMTVPTGVTVTLNLNGKTITGTDNSTVSFAIITNKGELTITGNGKMTLTATNNRGWNAYSSVISNTVGGKLIVENGTIEHLGGTDMAYGIDNLTNGKGTYAETVINGGTIKSPYRAIRMFLNGVEAQNILTVNGGTIEGANKSIWMQDPSKNANTGKLTVSANAVLNGDVYLYVTPGSTEWPVEVAIADAALAGNSEIITGNVVGKAVVKIDGIWTVVDGSMVFSADELQAALDAATDGAVIALGDDITGDVVVEQKADTKITIDGNGKTFAGIITVDGKSATYTTAGLTIKNLTFKADSISADACINLGEENNNNTRYTCNVTVENCTFDVPGAVGVKSYTGGDKNLTITGCTATANAHSLVQAKGIDGVLVENCEVYSKNGLNFNNSDNVTVKGCTVDVKGYAVRFGESSGGVGAAETYKIENCTLKSANDEGDATIILRGTADYSTLTIVNTTITGTPDINNTATSATVVK